MPFRLGYGRFRRRSSAKAFNRKRSFKSKSFSSKAMRLFRKSKSVKKARFARFAKGRKSFKRSARRGRSHFGGRITLGRIGGGTRARLKPTRNAARYVRQVARSIQGKGRKGPADVYEASSATSASAIDPGLSQRVYADLWGTGAQIGSLLTNVRAEAISTLLGGTVLYQPTLLTWGWSDVYIYSASPTDLNFEYVVYTAAGALSTNTLATDSSQFDNSWGDSYDARPTGYENWSTTSSLRNYAAWSPSAIPGWKVSHHGFGSAPVGKPVKLRFKFKTRRFTFQDYASSTFLNAGLVKNKSYRINLRFWGEHGQVCGTLSAVNQPILTTVGTQFMVRTIVHHEYRWIPGNNRPTVYGTQYGTNEAVDDEAYGWYGVNSLKAQRGGAVQIDAELAAGFPGYGGLGLFRKHEAWINPVIDCTGDAGIPTVDAGP